MIEISAASLPLLFRSVVVYRACIKLFVGTWDLPGKLGASLRWGYENKSPQEELKGGTFPQSSPHSTSSLQITFNPTPASLANTTALATNRKRDL